MIYFVWLKCLAQAFEVIAEVRSLDQDRLNEEVLHGFSSEIVKKYWTPLGRRKRGNSQRRGKIIPLVITDVFSNR